jgi:hypothetical protein
MTRVMVAASFAAALLCASCASVPVPNDQMAASEASVRGAQEAGAEDQPQAKLALQLAQDESAQAQQLLGQHENERARDIFIRARLDAELALQLTREAQAEDAARREADQLATMQSNP